MPPTREKPETDGEEDLWFLPGPLDEEEDAPGLSPLPRAPAATDLRRDWAQAEADHAASLARVAMVFGALDERLRTAPEGYRQRLALIEASDLSWQAGDRLGVDRLALWHGLHLAGVQDDALAFARAGWALRRLSGGPGPEADLAGFLGRHSGTIGDWTAQMAGTDHLHPITRAAMGFSLWRLAGDDAGGVIEAAVLGARLAAVDTRGGAVFLPLAQGGAGALRGAGSSSDRLAHWLVGAETACLAALLHLDRVADWHRRAEAASRDLSGRTPSALIALLADWPVVSAPLAERKTGSSRAAVQRNLDILMARGLLREITGQGRYRLWSAQL